MAISNRAIPAVKKAEMIDDNHPRPPIKSGFVFTAAVFDQAPV
jgi:hypothetical protein